MSGHEPTTRDVVVAGHRGERATVVAGWNHRDARVRVVALGALERLGILEDGVLRDAFADPDPSVRRRAVECAATRPGVDLVELLGDPDATVVEVAAWACGEQQVVSDTVLARLIELTRTASDPLVRESAAAALGAIGDPRGLSAILAACNDKPAVRRRAVLALAPFIGEDGVDAALDRALHDRDWQVRQAAEDLHRAVGGDDQA